MGNVSKIAALENFNDGKCLAHICVQIAALGNASDPVPHGAEPCRPPRATRTYVRGPASGDCRSLRESYQSSVRARTIAHAKMDLRPVNLQGRDEQPIRPQRSPPHLQPFVDRASGFKIRPAMRCKSAINVLAPARTGACPDTIHPENR